MNTPTLETERLILRKFTENDLKAMYLIYSDKEVNRFLPWFPVKSMEETRKLFEERYMAQYTRPQAYAYAVCLKKDHIPVGHIHVDMEEPHWPAERILAPGYYDGSGKGGDGTVEKRRDPVYYGDA